jgi:hypothetical protein
MGKMKNGILDATISKNAGMCLMYNFSVPEK